MDQLVTGAWLQAHLGDEDLRVLDCHVVFERRDGELLVESGRAQWASAHIPNSSHIDLVHELSDTDAPYRFMMPSKDRIAAVMSTQGVGSGTRVVLYDRDRNMWAARVWWMLRAVGFDDAAVLDGGWRMWTREGRPVSVAEPDHRPGVFEVVRREEVFVDKEAVLAAIDNSAISLVNALGEDEHHGRTANYGRRGHIPTAVNVPAASLVDDETHAYLDPGILRRRMAPVLDSGKTAAIAYCGGGISASSVAFVLRILRWEDVAIYDASMSEWGEDPELPLTLADG